MEDLDNLIKQYKKETPKVKPLWDTSESAMNEFVDMDEKFLRSGIAIFNAPFNDLWDGLYEPFVYEGITIWNDEYHDDDKIAKVIWNWMENIALSPMFLFPHASTSKALVPDGKHRLTVARYMGCDDIPFMVQGNKTDWITQIIPSAKIITKISTITGGKANG